MAFTAHQPDGIERSLQVDSDLGSKRKRHNAKTLSCRFLHKICLLATRFLSGERKGHIFFKMMAIKGMCKVLNLCKEDE